MEEPKKSVGIKMPESRLETAKLLGRSINGGLCFCLDLSNAIYAAGISEVRTFFSPVEWKFLVEALRSHFPDQACLATSKEELCRVIGSAKASKYAKEFKVDTSDMASRIMSSLNAMHIYAVWMRVRDYQVNHRYADEDGWAVFSTKNNSHNLLQEEKEES